MKFEDIPNEVIWVLTLPRYVGSDTYEDAEKIIAKYPEWFPWETKYNSIPKEVHEAYAKEKYPDRGKPISIPVGVGLMTQIKESGVRHYNDYSKKPFKEIWQDFMDMEQRMKDEEAKRYKKDKKLWNKHYKKYNLEFRE